MNIGDLASKPKYDRCVPHKRLCSKFNDRVCGAEYNDSWMCFRAPGHEGSHIRCYNALAPHNTIIWDGDYKDKNVILHEIMEDYK